MTNAAWANGSTLTRAGSVIAELTSIGQPRRTLDTIDVTSFSSPDGYREFLGSLRDGGEIVIEGNFFPGDTNGQKALSDDFDTGASRTYVITGPAALAYTWTMTGIVTQFEGGALTVDGAVTFTATIKVSGKPVLAVTASTGMSDLEGEDSAAGALTFNPVFAIGTFDYVVDVGNSITYVKLTPTAANHTIEITNSQTGATQTVSSGNQSGELALGAAGTITTLTIRVYEPGKVAKNYVVRINKAA